MNINYNKWGILAVACGLTIMSVDAMAAPRKRKVTKKAKTEKVVKATAPAAIAAPKEDEKKKDDDSFKQVMTLEREFAPIIQDANKLDRQPAMETPIISRSAVSYANWTATPAVDDHITTLSAGQVFEEQPFDNKRGYIDVNAGYYLTANVDAGFNIIDNNGTLFKAFGGFNFLKDDIDCLQNHTWKSKSIGGHGALVFNKEFDTFNLSAKLGYRGNCYNFMNYRLFVPEDLWTEPFQQKTRDLDVEVGFNNIDHGNDVELEALAKVNCFSLQMPDMGEVETLLKGRVLLPILDYEGGVKASINTLSYSYSTPDQSYLSIPEYWVHIAQLKSSVHASATPYFHMDLDEWQLDLGVRADFITGTKQHFGFAPDVHVSYDIMGDKHSLYADLVGGLDRYSVRSEIYNNPFYMATGNVNNPWTVCDMTIGYKNAMFGNYRGQVYVGAKYTMDELTPIASSLIDDFGTYTYMTNNDNLTLKVGAAGNYTYNKYFSLDATAEYYYRQEEKCNSMKPKFKVDIHAYSKPVKELIVDLSFNGQFGRDVWDNYNKKQDLKNILDLGVKVSYKLPYNLTVYGSINNALNQKYNVWCGIPAPGFHGCVGATWSF